MKSSKNWNKNAALFASGLVCSLAFRLPISIANLCIVRFNLDSSCLSIFTSIIVNAMLVGQLLGNWFGVLFTALDGKLMFWVQSVSSWLYLISFSFALFSFVNSDTGRLTFYYWSIVIANFFAKVSDAQCLEIATPESTNWYVFSLTFSPIYLLLIKTLLLKLINWNDDKNTLNRVTAMATRSVKTTVDYRVAKWMFVITIVLTALICVLWTVVFILVASSGTSKIKKNKITSLKYVTGIVIGTILTVPGALLGMLIVSPTIKCFTYFLSEAACVMLTIRCPMVFCSLGAFGTFVSAISVFCNVRSDYGTWLPSSMNVSKTDHGKYLGIGLGGGLFLGLCFGALAIRCKAYICKRTVIGLAGGALVGAAVGILIYEVMTAAVNLNGVTIASHEEEEDVDEEEEDYEEEEEARADVQVQQKSLKSDRDEEVENSARETVEELLKKKVKVDDLPTLDAIRSWADRNEDGKSRGLKSDNNRWARALQTVDNVNVKRSGDWDLTNARQDDTTVLYDTNVIEMKFIFSAASYPGQTLAPAQHATMKEALQQATDNAKKGLVTVQSVTGSGTGSGGNQGKVVFSVKLQVLGKDLNHGDKDTIEKAVQKRLKEFGKVPYSMNAQWNFTKAIVSIVMGVKQGPKDNQITVTVSKVTGAKNGDKIEEGEKKKIKNAVQNLINRELGNESFLVENVTAEGMDKEKIKIVITLSESENVWAKALQKVGTVDITKSGQWDLSRARVSVSNVTLANMNQLKITANLMGAVVGHVPTTYGKKKLEENLQEIIVGAFASGAVTSNALTTTVNTTNTINIVLNIENVWAKELKKVKKVEATKKREWDFSRAEVNVTNRDVTTNGNEIKITVTYVTGAKNGDKLDPGEGEERIKKAVENAINKIGSGRVNVTKLTGKATDAAKVELTATVERVEHDNTKETLVKETGEASRTKSEIHEQLKLSSGEPQSDKTSEIVGGWVSSLVMDIFGLGTVYSIYPGMAPCSITDISYINRINTVIQILTAISPIVIVYISETTSSGPEGRWEGAARGWYVGLLFVIVQNVSMIVVIFVVHCPENKLANVMKMSPVVAGALTVTIVTCQAASTCIGYAGVVANSNYNSAVINLNNTATMTTMVVMSLFGEGYLTELKKYESGMWPTQGMGKWESHKWWRNKAFANAWQICRGICTTDLRRDIMLCKQ